MTDVLIGDLFKDDVDVAVAPDGRNAQCRKFDLIVSRKWPITAARTGSPASAARVFFISSCISVRESSGHLDLQVPATYIHELRPAEPRNSQIWLATPSSSGGGATTGVENSVVCFGSASAGWRFLRIKRFQHVVHIADQRGPVADQLQASALAGLSTGPGTANTSRP